MSMIILPAIDLLDNKCVRLYKGKYELSEVVADDAFKVAKEFIETGASWMHVVDLNGAREGSPANFDTICGLCKLDIKIETGGGIRNIETVDRYLKAGVKRVILGSSAIEDEKFLKVCLNEYPKNIAVGIDAENKIVKTRGWLNDSKVNYIDFAKRLEDLGVKVLIFTDISRDGTLNGPNLVQLEEIKSSVGCDIIASGGIKNIDDIKNLNALKVYGAICGKSIYSGTLSLKEALIYEKNIEV